MQPSSGRSDPRAPKDLQMNMEENVDVDDHVQNMKCMWTSKKSDGQVGLYRLKGTMPTTAKGNALFH